MGLEGLSQFQSHSVQRRRLMPKIETWVISRRLSLPEVPEGDWYKDFGTFKICGEGKLPKTFCYMGT